MKVIDLLNKIANGEEIPKKFTYKGYFWEYDKRNEMWFTYFTRCGEMKNHRFDRLFYLSKCLNDEIKITEEDKKIKKISDFYEEQINENGSMSEPFNKHELKIIDKINEIIDKINKEK